ncbi:MAG TPA: serine protease [Candidatus Obscuribacterales bacterium]
MPDYYPGWGDQPSRQNDYQSAIEQEGGALERVHAVQHQAGDVAVLPTLRVGEAPDANDRTFYPRNLNLVDIFLESEPAVVHIKGDKTKQEQGKTVPVEVTGTGFFVTPEGKLATAYHVVKDASNLKVKAADGTVYTAKIDTYDPSTDLAILKVENNNPLKTFQVLPLRAGGADLYAGTPVAALGHPRGWNEMFVSPGHFRTTRLLRDVLSDVRGGALPGENPNRLIQEYEINVQNGNSGGPVLDESGRVVGVIGLSNSRDTAQATPVEDLVRLLNHSQKIGKRQAAPTAGTIDLDALRRMNLSLSGGYGSITNYSESFPGSLPSSKPADVRQETPGSRKPSGDLVPFKLPEKGERNLSSPQALSQDAPSVSHTLVHGVNFIQKLHSLRSGARPGAVGGLLSMAAGGYDLVYGDLSRFKQSLESGSTKEILTAGAQVAADGLLIAGGLGSMTSRLAVPGAIASLTGSGIKVISDGTGYARLLK